MKRSFHNVGFFLPEYFLTDLEQANQMARIVKCIKLGHEAEGLDFQTYPGELGKRIFDNVSKEAWSHWIKHQTMLVNENRLNLSDPKARKYLAEQLEAHFFGAGAEQPVGYVAPENQS
jgi:Fe-S cluster biosynthesis and repair protein YggX